MEDDRVSGFLNIFASCFRSKQYSEVSVKDNKPNYSKIYNICNIPPLNNVGVWKNSFPEAEHSGMKEVQRLCGQSDEQIRKNRQHACCPDETNQRQSSLHSADLHMAQREADGDVTLHCHASEVQRCVFSGEKSKQDEDATDRDIYFVDGVADHKQDDG